MAPRVASPAVRSFGDPRVRSSAGGCRAPTPCSPTRGSPRRGRAARAATLVKAAVGAAQQRVRRGRDRAGGRRRRRRSPRCRAPAPSLRPVLNATGVLVHTNLGRAPLSAAARRGAGRRGRAHRRRARPGHRRARARAGAARVEALLGRGARRRRGACGQQRRRRARAGRDARSPARPGDRGRPRRAGRDRRRLPHPRPAGATGARLREVGTTNRVTLADYAAAVGPDTAFVLKVHPSNFVVRGFTRAVDVARAGAASGVPVVADIGSGLLAPHPLLPDEPDAATALRRRRHAGHRVAATSSSAGRRPGWCSAPRPGADLVERLRRHPLARALRVDKLTLAALEATLRGPRPPPGAAPRRRPRRRCRARAERLARPLRARRCRRRGGRRRGHRSAGAARPASLPSAAVALPERFAAPCGRRRRAVVGRVERGRCLLDLRRCRPAADDAPCTAAVLAADARCTSSPRPATSTTASRRWSARSPGWSPTAGPRSAAAA